MYEVIGSRQSRAFRVLWMLEEMGEPYAHLPVPPRSDEVRAVNPSGKIPVLRVDGATLSDSVAIMTFLGDYHSALTFEAGSLERARQDALTQKINDEMDAILWVAARHSFILPKELRVPEVKKTLLWEYERHVGYIDRLIEGPFLMGETMTHADILLTHCLGWAKVAKFPDAPQNLSNYFARMRERPAYIRASKLP
ncbi:MAG: glutathione S-transferase family protein [Pseudomonadota bacterium]